ncbi:MEDS domain-containing protein [Actinosynnema sp. NPDC023658]|uniref:MEDS domain-containing protein n=1 Tax=Actinosynnema sp. NPDC023658 TaxID=3155465 RepID=UPI0033C9500F
MRIIGEPIGSTRTDAEHPACAQHEAMMNLASAGRDLTILCQYDTSCLDPRVLGGALVTHPCGLPGARCGVGGRYDPDAIVSRLNRRAACGSCAGEARGGSAELRSVSPAKCHISRPCAKPIVWPASNGVVRCRTTCSLSCRAIGRMTS